jgi:hypothetical protein
MDNPDTPEAAPFEQALQDALADAEALGQPAPGPFDIAHPDQDDNGPHGTD